MKISNYFESLNGNLNEITLDLKKVLDETAGEIDEIDRMFGNYSVGSHLQSDFYANKIAFVIALNFPYFTLAEKEQNWVPPGAVKNGQWLALATSLCHAYRLNLTRPWQSHR